ncbi:MAG: YggS family pyridoxal phosphate-dependent enzyme [Faecalibacterium sp.]|nr:YggS family pyridoxal phosphate-dependent enzyme [Ruminococcus sp.]MCM1391750.1 YggS family pyridoxal phosphate-dependent enzyme [Ruminococcus sp.]MCM1485030.1 YggS family pyridoxal phosphate-dependent enzyme [Faecalibacterium sp.]
MTRNLSVEERFLNIEHNLRYINDQIEQAAKKSGRTKEDITLMAVTKTVEPMFINHAIACGINLIGENKVQEFLSKEEYLKLDKCDAHLIGHLQTNKVKQIVGKVSMIQSVDSVKLAREISKQSVKNNVVTKCLIEVNVGEEESKSGIAYDNVMPLIEEIVSLESIKVEGLMAIPPICDDNQKLCEYFEKMNALFIDIKGQNIDNIDMSVLSMGMSGDYREAIACGATMVRVGSSIFGPRLY